MQKTGDLSPELIAALEEERERGEQLLWTARSQPVVVSKGFFRVVEIALGIIFLSVGFCLVKLGFDILPDVFGIPWFFIVLGALVALCGLWQVFLSPGTSPTLTRTVYAITTKRVLIIIIELIGTRRETRSFVPRDANLLRRVEREGGIGDLYLGAAGTTPTGDAPNIALMNVGDVRGVERIVRETFFANATKEG